MGRRSLGYLASAAAISLAALLVLELAGTPAGTAMRGVLSRETRLAATSMMFDDFNGPAGSPPDPRWWTFETGRGIWGNDEAQRYTNEPANVRLDGEGNLVIEARHEGGVYTSGRLNTKGRVWLNNGRVEARIRVPRGAGLHPAFWLMGADLDAVGWPQSGEIDVLETISDAGHLFNALHGPNVGGGDWDVTLSTTIDPSFVDEFHTYWMQKEPGQITVGVDDRVTADFRPADLSPDHQWVFDKPFFLLLNVAVGGDWSGPANSSTPFPAAMAVAWVRVTGD